MFAEIAYIFVGFVGIVWILSSYYEDKVLKKKASRFPGPREFPLIGSAYVVISGSREAAWKAVQKLFITYSSPFRVKLGFEYMIILHEPEQMKRVLTSPSMVEKSDFYRFAEPWLGNGLFVSPASIWRAHRKLIQPTFNQKILETFVGVFQEQAIIFSKEVLVASDRKEVAIVEHCLQCALNIICETTMGVDALSGEGKSEKYFENGERVMEKMRIRLFSFWQHPDVIYHLTQDSKDFKEAVKYLNNFTNEVVRKKRQQLESGTNQTDQSQGQRKRFLDFFMELEGSDKAFTDQELREEVETIIFGGHDTTGVTLSYAMLMLASHPDIQDKIYEELYGIYGSEDPEEVPTQSEDLKLMNYTERFIKETLRLFPIAPIIMRKVVEDLDIGEGHILPKGCNAVLGIMHVQRNEKYWTDPLKFDPDRFLPEEIAKRHPYSFIPFSAGPRNCIGFQFATMSMKTVLATVLRKCIIKKEIIKPIKDIELSFDILLKPVDPITVRFEKRIKK